MFALSRLVLPIALVVAALPCACGGAPRYEENFRQANNGLIIMGDTQRTLPVELLAMRREQNDAERKILIHEITRLAPDGLVLLGDLVADGSSSHDWRRFDKLMEPARSAGIPCRVVLGNHDYWGDNRSALANIRARFASLASSNWYALVYAELGLLFVDSNQGDFSGDEWAAQQSWFSARLDQYDGDPGIKGVFVFGHHPPYTNSTVTGDEVHVQEAFAKRFAQSEKALAFITGHAHSYERFQYGTKMYIVSGGGGGPRVPLLQGSERRHVDVYQSGSDALRKFHFIQLEATATGARLTVRGIDKGGSVFDTLESFELEP